MPRQCSRCKINKSDRNDAIGIARIMQTGWFKEVHVKDFDSHSVRASRINLRVQREKHA
jgi:transposase